MYSPTQDTRESSPISPATDNSSTTVDHTQLTELTTPATSLHGTPSPKEKPSPLSRLSRKRTGRLVLALAPPTTTTCSKCDSPIPADSPNTIPFPCGHTNCHECTYLSVLLALHSAALGAPFQPARCCDTQALPLFAVGRAAAPAEFLAYKMRLHEAGLRPEDRLYCYAAECGMYITKKTARVGTCPRCFRRTCRRCGRRSHMFPCPSGTAFRRPVGKIEGWLKGVEKDGEDVVMDN